jgi:hypothetical protein
MYAWVLVCTCPSGLLPGQFSTDPISQMLPSKWMSMFADARGSSKIGHSLHWMEKRSE